MSWFRNVVVCEKCFVLHSVGSYNLLKRRPFSTVRSLATVPLLPTIREHISSTFSLLFRHLVPFCAFLSPHLLLHHAVGIVRVPRLLEHVSADVLGHAEHRHHVKSSHYGLELVVAENLGLVGRVLQAVGLDVHPELGGDLEK